LSEGENKSEGLIMKLLSLMKKKMGACCLNLQFVPAFTMNVNPLGPRFNIQLLSTSLHIFLKTIAGRKTTTTIAGRKHCTMPYTERPELGT